MEPSGSVRVPLGRTVATPAALAAVSPLDIAAALRRHASGDWGDVDPDDRAVNDDALRSGERLLSVYRSANGVTFWVLTEADRSATTVLLPDDY
ncbi:MAG: hypothetical protein K2V38_09900 [Gemmataceae bacterium]|nr:hypothetical protein [Gemmataceae bacterium]